MLGPDGASKAYVKRRFAADFKDNAAGDFLLSMDLGQGHSDGGSRSDMLQQGGPPPTLLETAVALVLLTAEASRASAALHRQLHSRWQSSCGLQERRSGD